MVNVSTKLIVDSDGAIQGAITVVRGLKYVAVILKLLLQKLHNELKSQFNHTILALRRIGAPFPNQRAAEIGIHTLHMQIKLSTCNYFI